MARKRAKASESPIDLDAIEAPGQTPETADAETDLEEKQLLRDSEKLHQERIRAETESFKSNTRQRKSYALRIYILTTVWLVLVLLIVVFSGFSAGGARVALGGTPVGFKLSDTVLLALIGTTTANIVGVLVVVVKYFFPVSEIDKNSK